MVGGSPQRPVDEDLPVAPEYRALVWFAFLTPADRGHHEIQLNKCDGSVFSAMDELRVPRV